MREIIWDTETTGFDPDSGDRLVEIARLSCKATCQPSEDSIAISTPNAKYQAARLRCMVSHGIS